MAPVPDTFDIARMTPQEHLDLIGALWDSLSPQEVPISKQQQRERERRIAAHDAGLMESYYWPEVERRLLTEK